MRRWWLWIALLLSLGVNIGVLLTLTLGKERAPSENQQERSAPAQRRIEAYAVRMADELKLQGVARSEFVDIQRQFFEHTFKTRRRVASLQNELRAELSERDTDRREVERLLEDLTASYGQMERGFVENLLRSREMLDERQEKRFLRFLSRLRERGNAGFGRGFGPRSERRWPRGSRTSGPQPPRPRTSSGD